MGAKRALRCFALCAALGCAGPLGAAAAAPASCLPPDASLEAPGRALICYPAPDLVSLKLAFPRVFFYGGVFFSQTPVVQSHPFKTRHRGLGPKARVHAKIFQQCASSKARALGGSGQGRA